MRGDIWTEKYRPTKLDQVVGQEIIIRRLKSLIEKKALTHCLFSGPAGIGKTTIALAIANELYGERWKGNFLELNASDERGIDTIRDKVKEFARTMALGSGFKIVYLDEADALTKDAQHALRRIMEQFSEGCRFILSCNYSSRIIPPIQSRCAIFRFSPLSMETAVKFLENIAATEGVKTDADALLAIYDVSQGDMRRAINLMQSAAFDGAINKEKVYALSSKDPEKVRIMLKSALDGSFRSSRETLHELLDSLSGEDVVKEIHGQVMEIQVPEDHKLRLLEKVGECEFRIVEGSDPRIQLESLLAQIAAKK